MTTPEDTFGLPNTGDGTLATDDDETPVLSDEDESDEEEESDEDESITYESWMQALEANPAIKEAYTTRTTEREKELSTEIYRKFQSAIQPAVDRWSQNSAATKNALSTIANNIQKAVADGNLEADDVASILNSNQSALDAFNQQQFWEGTNYILHTLGAATENESFANEFFGRMYAMASGKTDVEFASDLLSAIVDPAVIAKVKEAEDAAYARGLQDGGKVKAETIKAETRSGKGPDLNPKKSRTAKPKYTMEQLKKMTREEILQIPREDRESGAFLA